LPGQWEDEESGLHYNDQRYYDPEAGRYISPDPLGLEGGLNGYVYVGNNPLGYGDPLGLILFAFDGTGNTNHKGDLRQLGGSTTNVWRFTQAYQSGNARYITGVGTRHRDTQYGDIVPEEFANNTRLDIISGDMPLHMVDMGGNYSGPARVERMMRYLQDEANAASDNEAMDIDIVGFSRGASQAREFANRIVANTRGGWYRYTAAENGQQVQRCQRVSFRFMGLFDTVLSTNWSGAGYNLAIPPAFAHVAHAVALNEYRSDSLWNFSTRNPLPWDQHWGGFPLESIGASSNAPGRVRTEMGFLGAHADIGGGYPDGENQLSLVALNWMVAQARAAGVAMRGADPLPIANPVLHDKSNAIRMGDPRRTDVYLRQGRTITPVRAEDREVRGTAGGRTQRAMQFGNNSMINADTHQFISYAARDVNAPVGSPLNPRSLGERTGTVDITGYLRWLREHGYGF
ncbi:MAG: RHS repeat-associated core domain-containing protein, partial [Pseudomonadota bacterium]